jgi:hypothetical protein
MLVQLHSRSGVVCGQPFEQPDFIELQLAPDQRVISVGWTQGPWLRGRKTVDWTWTVWIESRFPSSDV